jgi:hypothetical protein
MPIYVVLLLSFFINKLFMRGRIEMNIIKQIASRGLIYVLAVAVLGTGFLMTGDNNAVEAEKLSSVYLTNKATGLTTEASPPSTRSAPASRKNASTVYVTMTDVDTANAVKNSHLINANKVVITVDEADHNTKVAAKSALLNLATATDYDAGKTFIVPGLAGSPVIDSDGDGDLSDEVSSRACQDGETITFDGASWGAACSTNAARTSRFLIVSVSNGSSASNASETPIITMTFDTSSTDNVANGDDLFTGYYTSAVNTFQVKAWSTVQLESNASWISVVETGRNTGIFEAEFVVADTEGINDGAAVATMAPTVNQGATSATGYCGDSTASAVAGQTAAADGRFDASGGVNADCEWLTLGVEQDMLGANATAGTPIQITGTYTLPANVSIIDTDKDGSILDEFYFQRGGTGGTDIATTNMGQLSTVTACTASAGTCDSVGAAARTLTLTVNFAANITNGTADRADVLVPVGNNVVDFEKVDTTNSGGVTAADLKSGRVGSDTISASANHTALGSVTGLWSNVQLTGVDRTPVVEAQANSTITVQYQDLTDNSSSTSATVGTKIKSTVTVDTDAPSPVVLSPSAGTSFKDRQPVFTGSVSDIGSGLDVSTVNLYVDIASDPLASGLTSVASSAALAGSWLGGAGSVDLNQRYQIFGTTLDNTTTMVDGVTSATWSVTTSTNIPCDAANNDGLSVVDTGASTHTNFVRAATTCNTQLTTPDTTVDYFTSATDLAGNRGFSDYLTSNSASRGPADPYTFNVDEKKPELDDANTETGVYYDPGTTAEKTGSLDKMVVAFNDEILTAPASAFKVTTDAGAVLTPIAAEVGTKGTDANGASYDFRKNVYITLPSNLASDETPKVQIIENVSDLAGNTNKSDTTNNAVDKIKPTLTLAIAGGSGTGAAGTSNDSDSLTKSAMTITVTTSEVLSGSPTVSVFAEDYGSGSSYASIVADFDIGALAAAGTQARTINTKTVIDTDKDGSLTDEIVISAATNDTVPAAQLVNISVSSVVNSNANTIITLKNGNSATLDGTANNVNLSGNFSTAGAADTTAAAEGTVVAVAQDSTTYVASFSGTSFSDAAAKDTKAIVISATDVNSNTGTTGTRDQGSASVTKFRLDKTAPVLKNDPDGDGTVGSSTTLPRPYVIFEFTDNSDVTVQSASFGGDDVLAKLATTNNKKYFMVPDADLAVKTYVVKAKGTDLAGNKGSEASYNLKVSSRKDYKATVLAGWNLMSFPSDPVTTAVGSVFDNSGIDQVVGYNALAKGSPWTVATKDSASGAFSGSLSDIHAGSGYWVHSSEFSSQSVALTGPEGPSASAPPTIDSIALASGWNLIGVTDATKASTQANEGTRYKSNASYLGSCNGSSISKAYEYNTTNLAWSEISIEEGKSTAFGTAGHCASADDNTTVDAEHVNIGEAFWVFAKPASGILTPIVP